MIEIRSNKGDYFVFDPDTELISMNGFIVPYSDYQPVYVRNSRFDDDIPPLFIGILDKINNSIISINGNINNVIDNDNEIKL